MPNHRKPSPTYVTVNLRVPLDLARTIDQLHVVEAAKVAPTSKSRFARTTVSKHAMYIEALALGVPALVRDLSGESQQATVNHVATVQPSSTMDNYVEVTMVHGVVTTGEVPNSSASKLLFDLSGGKPTEPAPKYHDASDPLGDELDELMEDV